MRLKGIIYEDFSNYKDPSMFLISPYCTFKCDNDAKCSVCQNSSLASQKPINVPTQTIINRFLENPITKSVVIGGMEPLDTFDETIEFISLLRNKTESTVIIYTGYYKDECSDKIEQLKKYKNIIVKFGRFIPNQKHVFDNVLGVELASPNQYAEVIS